MIIRAITSKNCRNLVSLTNRLNQHVRLESSVETRFTNYDMIYKFPLIRVASVVNKLKLFQLAVTGISIPATVILAAFDITSTQTAIMFSLTGLSWCGAFCAVGFFGHNRVGYVYLKNDEKSVKISYTNFWGSRVDIDVDTDDLWPLNDLPTSIINPFYYSLRRFSTKDTLKFNIKYGIIIDPVKFEQVFGSVTLPKNQ